MGGLSLFFGDVTEKVADFLCQHFLLGEIRNLLRQSILQRPSNVQHRLIVMICPEFRSVILSNQIVDELVAAHKRCTCLQLHRVFFLHWVLHTLVIELALPKSPLWRRLACFLGVTNAVPQFEAQSIWPNGCPIAKWHLNERFFRQNGRVCVPTVLRLVLA